MELLFGKSERVGDGSRCRRMIVEIGNLVRFRLELLGCMKRDVRVWVMEEEV